MNHEPAFARPGSRRYSFAQKGVWPALAVLLAAGTARALPGTHGPSISTWDTRASSVVIGFRPGFLSGGHFDMFSYNANFTATSGKLSSQFGLHYMNVRPDEGATILHGIGATAVALFDFPVRPRYDDGMPKLAVGLYIGAAPVALINERTSHMSIPFPIGVGLPWAPAKAVYISPWFEASPGANLDTRIREATLPVDPNLVKPNPDGSFTLTDAAVNQILANSVDYKLSASLGLRAGLDIGVRLGPSVDLNVNGMIGSLGGAFGGTTVGWVGGGFTFRWDDVVAAVLPTTTEPTPVSPGTQPMTPAPPPPLQAPTQQPPAPAPTYQAPPPAASQGSMPPLPPPGPAASPPAPAAAPAVPTTSFPQ
jgi:hypothetical protein